MKKLSIFLSTLFFLLSFHSLGFTKVNKKKNSSKDVIEQPSSLSEAERIVFSLRAQERWIKAALEYKKFLETLPPDEQRRREAEAAEIFFKARLYPDAATYYAKLAERSPNDAEVLDKLVSSYVRSNQFDQALASLDKLEAVSSKSTPSLEYRRIFILTDANRCETAIPTINRFLENYPKSQKADEALWQKLWCEYKLGKNEQALATLNTYESLYGSKTAPGKTSYWRMRFLSAAGKKEEAEREKESLLNQDHFYAEWMKQQKGKTECPAKSFLELQSAGLTSSDPGIQELVQRFSKKEKVPEKLIWAIMYQESHFKPEALSPVGASGLLQLMPETGYDMAEDLKISPFDPQDLTNPSLNIHLGVHYLAILLEKFSGSLPYAIAAYNAGPDAVERWTKLRDKSNCDEFIETIPYRETNNYVRKVLGYYWN